MILSPVLSCLCSWCSLRAFAFSSLLLLLLLLLLTTTTTPVVVFLHLCLLLRAAVVARYMFYKNIAFVLTQFWYSVYTGWSGQKYYIELATQTFNLIYTGWPIVILALFDQDVSAEMSIKFPVLYRDGPAGRRLNNSLFWGWVVSALVESLITFFCTAFAFRWVFWRLFVLLWVGGRVGGGWGRLVLLWCCARASGWLVTSRYNVLTCWCGFGCRWVVSSLAVWWLLSCVCVCVCVCACACAWYAVWLEWMGPRPLFSSLVSLPSTSSR